MVRNPQNPLLQVHARSLPTRVAIIGAETIGPEIGYYLKSAVPGLELTLMDGVPELLERGLARIGAQAKAAAAHGRMTEAQATSIAREVRGTTDYAAIGEADWVIETATDDLVVKRRILTQVEAVVGPQALITSHTGSFPAAVVFSDLEHKHRATVVRFFAPAWRNPVVEVARAREADPEIIEYVRWLLCTTGKVPLTTADVEGLMLDRVLNSWRKEAAHCLEWASAAQIDSVAAEWVQAGPLSAPRQSKESSKKWRPDVAARVRGRLLGALWSQCTDILDRDIGGVEDLELGCRLALGFRRGPIDMMREAGEAKVWRVLRHFTSECPGIPLPRRSLEEYQRFQRGLLVDRVDDVIVITLRRPEALNALHDELNDEILRTIERFENDRQIKGFVLVGYATRAFCAGADIGRFAGMLGDEATATQYARECSRVLVHLDRMSKPVVAALNGMALGGGLELAMRCHAIVALRGSWLQFPEISLGLLAGIGGMVIPYRRWPHAAALFHRMLLGAERVDAARAYEAGIVSELADDYASLIKAAVARVHALTGVGRATLDTPLLVERLQTIGEGSYPFSREVRGIIDEAVRAAAAQPGVTAALEIGYAAFGRCACTSAAREGVMAFLAGRKPDFSRTG